MVLFLAIALGLGYVLYRELKARSNNSKYEELLTDVTKVSTKMLEVMDQVRPMLESIKEADRGQAEAFRHLTQTINTTLLTQAIVQGVVSPYTRDSKPPTENG